MNNIINFFVSTPIYQVIYLTLFTPSVPRIVFYIFTLVNEPYIIRSFCKAYENDNCYYNEVSKFQHTLDSNFAILNEKVREFKKEK